MAKPEVTLRLILSLAIALAPSQVWRVADAGVGGKLVRVLHGHAGPVNDVNAKWVTAGR